ncbi:hypothetical protein [Siminovitchia fordii]|uniref:Uncharacterized protein n=1 Tax=Siminovitchia fordii TaxID=254759 RepID=A0ABQ4KA82_9BACI|nr:hypothetical protein [Siminovitchia fordii]GIN22630.1 hypothetical protein J1TS3_37640 [Siminovitchia fordii]
MTTEQYNELINELNFHDNSVGINQITLKDHETIKEILTEFNYIPIGHYETINSEGFKFKDDKETYSIQEYKNGLNIYKLIEL